MGILSSLQRLAGTGGGQRPSTSPSMQDTQRKKLVPPSVPLASMRGPAAVAHTAPSPSRGTTVQEAVKARDILLEAKGANASSGQAVTLLQQMMEPGPLENAALEEVKALLGDIVERLIAQEDRLDRIESRLTGPRIVSIR